jgi:hypothetical protein
MSWGIQLRRKKEIRIGWWSVNAGAAFGHIEAANEAGRAGGDLGQRVRANPASCPAAIATRISPTVPSSNPARPSFCLALTYCSWKSSVALQSRMKALKTLRQDFICVH